MSNSAEINTNMKVQHNSIAQPNLQICIFDLSIQLIQIRRILHIGELFFTKKLTDMSNSAELNTNMKVQHDAIAQPTLQICIVDLSIQLIQICRILHIGKLFLTKKLTDMSKST